MSIFQFLLRQPTAIQISFKLTTNIFTTHVGKSYHQQKGKMNFHSILIAIVLTIMCKMVAVNIMPELQKNVLNFGYGVNFKYEEMLSHSFDRFYVVAKYEIPKMENLKLTTFSFDLMCNHLNISKKSYLLRYIRHCRRIAPYVTFYKQQIDYYNWTAYNILQKDIRLILPSFKDNNIRNKRFITTILGTIGSKVIGLAFEGISSFLHHKRHKALHKAVKQINERKDLEHNRIYHVEDTVIMYGKYNSDTLMDLIEMVHKMHNLTTWKEKIFTSKMNDWLKNELSYIHNEFDYSVDATLLCS